jgi:hypothetical protein
MTTGRSSASVLARLLEVAKQRGEDYSLLLNRFGLERLLDRLTKSRHDDRFLLKGALLFSLWYDQPHRPTRDADLLGFGPSDAEHLATVFREIADFFAFCGCWCQSGASFAAVTFDLNAATRADPRPATNL